VIRLDQRVYLDLQGFSASELSTMVLLENWGKSKGSPPPKIPVEEIRPLFLIGLHHHCPFLIPS